MFLVISQLKIIILNPSKYTTMKRFELFKIIIRAAAVILLLLSISIASTGQINITSGDMPNTGDTIRQSTNITTGGINYMLTGENYTWDFSTLFPLVQT